MTLTWETRNITFPPAHPSKSSPTTGLALYASWEKRTSSPTRSDWPCIMNGTPNNKGGPFFYYTTHPTPDHLLIHTTVVTISATS